MAQMNCKQSTLQNYGVGGGVSHSRSSSQPTFFGNHSLPPLSPSLPQSETSLASSSSNKDVSMDEVDVSSRGPPMVGSSLAFDNGFRANFDGLPPRRGHRRSSSDVPLGFDVMIQTSPQLVPISGQRALGQAGFVNDKFGRDLPLHLQKQETKITSDSKSALNGTFGRTLDGVDDLFQSYMNLNEDKRSLLSCSNKSSCEMNDIKAETMSKRSFTGMDGTISAEGNKRSASEDIGPSGRHLRSLSVDSAFGNLHFGEDSPKMPVNDNLTKFNLEFGNGEFSESELKKIMADERLAEIALSDPKRAKRVLANRQSAARSKERKLRYISELEHKVQTLQSEATTLSTQLTVLQKDFTEITNQNNELKFRLQAMEQQARLRDGTCILILLFLNIFAALHVLYKRVRENGCCWGRNIFIMYMVQFMKMNKVDH
ncbi:OLC1v1018165C3 [Oldenlandia corymbosa var. corymbosa]|uniref:OLC1v1018165C3 n=1 Tax=Oldenlandia corymbosa var. corymbosa TaxID=529605 RepID=A0AAV1EB04_OLDCO|nr:OLC1v1018165C3 [Oldenlandia corymbosa var. corymbosa]